MLIVQFPQKLSTQEKRVQLLNYENDKKKIKSAVSKNIIASVVIFSMIFFVEALWTKLIFVFLGIVMLFWALFVYKFSMQIYDNRFYSEIHEDRIVHSQATLIFSRQKIITIFYDDIETSKQNAIGYLELILNSKITSHIEVFNRKGKLIKKISDRAVTLKFVNQEGKYYLINNMSDKIRYHR